MKSAAKWKRYGTSYLFLVPSFGFIATFLYYPILLAFAHSFTEWNLVKSTWVGLANFKQMWSEPTFTKGAANQLIYTLSDVVKAVVFPLLGAELIYLLGGQRLKYMFRTGFILPMLLPGIVTILLWQNIYDPTNGLLNQLLHLLGLNSTRAWLGEDKTAIWSIVMMGLPFISGLPFLIFYAAIGNMNQEQLESARIDGANGWNVFSRMHLPFLIPQFKVVIILTIISSLQDFVKILVMTGGGPGVATTNPAMVMYNAAFGSSQYGYGSAIGVSLFLVILVITLFNMKFLKTDY
ncbi:multiple sugar transport system permease protein/raffinose/stachyose/melibiose transport system permease protein [Paenibacillus taihuensis]|uniref:Multiple sugar transport system permease protein/raffinose/stachyose/melibiose transport system permease protein n=1 Tax=Paenibacillus taihuensis TaxID=1156355 RepID=A0A3D9Q3D3_9BACL|nr:sugar ABC transporter permease [Paenibacillus taihuensis]REE56286.1 multiple sugar transport system permease protein/raffinose/stachyose/melibiose transport system permease protein [Paenibacillus taihuensis]